ncbi:MAG: hypothetical protein KTR21_02585 [Rhodobacteraceae bacterium]|nr:hypothetical protein [Paracoccaceae bacterium]
MLHKINTALASIGFFSLIGIAALSTKFPSIPQYTIAIMVLATAAVVRTVYLLNRRRWDIDSQYKHRRPLTVEFTDWFRFFAFLAFNMAMIWLMYLGWSKGHYTLLIFVFPAFGLFFDYCMKVERS